ncbi:MAG: signal recognition particle-docking protein FtsY [Candidatus Babeliales bacterium]
MFGFIKEKLTKVFTQVTQKFNTLFSRKSIDQEALTELEKILIQADAGVLTTRNILKQVTLEWQQGRIQEGADLHQAVKEHLLAQLPEHKQTDCQVYLLVGINGSGKTTSAAKLASKLKDEGKRVLLVAGDTFRAAAVEQLAVWAKKIDVPLMVGAPEQDPASVIFSGCTRFKQEGFDALIIDTAGRLQTKVNLMKELEKIKKVIEKQLPDHTICTLLTVDAMLGQNSFDQAKLFHESTKLDGLVLTKMDGTGKGGIVFAITKELSVPVLYISYGEQLDQLKPFDKQEYIEQLLG